MGESLKCFWCFNSKYCRFKTPKKPDVNGVYTFQIEITQPGYNLIHLTQKVVVNPTPYDHYPRFLECAYPYYLSAFSMMSGVLSMSFVFLYHDDKNKKINTKKNK